MTVPTLRSGSPLRSDMLAGRRDGDIRCEIFKVTVEYRVQGSGCPPSPPVGGYGGQSKAKGKSIRSYRTLNLKLGTKNKECFKTLRRRRVKILLFPVAGEELVQLVEG
jgi:hypothetical protein